MGSHRTYLSLLFRNGLLKRVRIRISKLNINEKFNTIRCEGSGLV